jgi:hypothetical protein
MQTLFNENTPFSPLNDLGIFLENQVTINVKVYFWTLNSIPKGLSFASIALMLCNKF